MEIFCEEIDEMELEKITYFFIKDDNKKSEEIYNKLLELKSKINEYKNNNKLDSEENEKFKNLIHIINPKLSLIYNILQSKGFFKKEYTKIQIGGEEKGNADFYYLKNF